jgi:hypothetical protein
LILGWLLAAGCWLPISGVAQAFLPPASLPHFASLLAAMARTALNLSFQRMNDISQYPLFCG